MLGGAAGSAASGSGFTLPRVAMFRTARTSSIPVPRLRRGAITDDVPARLNAGEFVWPKDVVAWRGEQWMQKEILKARKEREQETVAEPEMAHGRGDRHARAADLQK